MSEEECGTPPTKLIKTKAAVERSYLRLTSTAMSIPLKAAKMIAATFATAMIAVKASIAVIAGRK